MQQKILIIGSSGHNRAHCVDWLQPFPNIEEYDSMIINLQSLTQEIFDNVQLKIQGMREPITTVLTTGREIFCIIDRLLRPSPAPRSSGASAFKGKGIVRFDYIFPTNYDWLPVKIGLSDQKKGTSINVYNHRFDSYFEYIDLWNFEMDLSAAGLAGGLSYDIEPIAVNKSKKVIAGSLKHSKILETLVSKRIEGAIHLLPPTTKCDTYNATEIILNLLCVGKLEEAPSWRHEIDIPKTREFKKRIDDKIIQINRIQQEISRLRNKEKEWDSYRDLLTETGDNLENVVQRVLEDLGIRTKKAPKSFPADLLSKEIVVEITGIKGYIGVSSPKVNQTARFKELHHKGEKIVLIANTHMNLPPKDRKGERDFSLEVINFFNALPVCCFTTFTLMQLWKDIISGKRDAKKVRDVILSKKGELTLDEFD